MYTLPSNFDKLLPMFDFDLKREQQIKAAVGLISVLYNHGQGNLFTRTGGTVFLSLEFFAEHIGSRANKTVQEMASKVLKLVSTGNNYKGTPNEYEFTETAKQYMSLFSVSTCVNEDTEPQKMEITKRKNVLLDGKYYTSLDALRKAGMSADKARKTWKTLKKHSYALVEAANEEDDKKKDKRKVAFEIPAAHNLDAIKVLLDEVFQGGKVDLKVMSKVINTREMMAVNNLVNLRNSKVERIQYFTTASGRMFAEPWEDVYKLTFSNLPKIARSVAFDGFFEYDIETAAPAILTQLYERLSGKKLVWTRLFVENKDLFRNRIAESCGIDYGTAKSALTSLFFGARFDKTGVPLTKTNFYFDLVEREGSYFRVIEVLKSLLEDEYFAPLTVEVGEIFEFLADHMEANFCKEVPEGKVYYTRHGDALVLPRKNASKIVAHLYQSEEANILKLLMQKYDYNLLLHDAFISAEEYDVEEMASYIKERSGFDLRFKKQAIVDELTPRMKVLLEEARDTL